MIHLITGYAGYEHIQSADDGAFNAAVLGSEQLVFSSGNKFAASIIDNNTVRIADGDGMMFGRHFRINPKTYEDVTITTGTAGRNRIDLICATYKKNEDDGTEIVYFEVIKGTEASTPKIPTYTTGNILEGAIFNQMPLYKVNISGVALTSVEPLFEPAPPLYEFIDGLIQWIATNGLTQAEKLWENASPTSSFAGQSVPISNITDYRLIVVGFYTSTSSQEIYSTGVLMRSMKDTINYITPTGTWICQRPYSVVSSGVYFNNCTKSGGYANEYLIPMWIYGIK